MRSFTANSSVCQTHCSILSKKLEHYNFHVSNFDARSQGIPLAVLSLSAAQKESFFKTNPVRYRKSKQPGGSLQIPEAGSESQSGAHDSNVRRLLEELAIGDDTVDSSDLVMEIGVVNGLAQARAAHESFHTIEMDASTFFSFGYASIDHLTYSVPYQSFARMNPEIANVVSGISARGGVTLNPSDFKPVRGQPIVTAKTHSCVGAALASAAFSLFVPAAANRLNGVIQKHNPKIILSLKISAESLMRQKGLLGSFALSEMISTMITQLLWMRTTTRRCASDVLERCGGAGVDNFRVL
eukprot:IDg14512t1